MEKVINPSCCLVADAGDLAQVGHRGPFDRLQRSEMTQQGALAGRPDAGDLLQAALTDVAAAALAVRADGEPMRLVAQTLHEIEHGVARRQFERRPPRHVEGLAAGIAVRTLSDRDHRYV